jgi:hypothetical protein
MKQKINLFLYKNLIYTDFFFIKYNSCLIKKNQNFSRFKFYQILNIFELLKTFKQFILLIKFIFSKYRNRIIINLNDAFNYKLMNFFFSLYPLKKQNNFIFLTAKLKIFSLQSWNNTSVFSFLYCLLGKDLKIILKNAKKLMDADIFLLTILALLNQFNNLNCYNINADFNEFKKLLFLILFINKIVHYYFLDSYNHLK